MRDRLPAFALGSFHATLLLVVGVALGYSGADLGRLLASVGTGAGLAAGALLWLVGWGAAAWVLMDADLRTPPVRALLARAMVAGMGAGAVFVPGLFTVLALAQGEFEPALLAVGVFGAVGGALVGSLVGLILAAIDAALYALARRALTASSA